MYRTAQMITLFLLLLFAVPQNIQAESTAIANTDVVAGDSLDRLAQAVESLTQLLEKQATAKDEDKELRKLDIAISYLNFRSRRIELMERDLSRQRADRDRYEDTIANWQKRQELLLKNLEESSPEDQKELEQAKKEFEIQTKSLEQRLARAEEDIIIQENRIAELQDQLDTVESYVHQHLEL